MLINPYEKPEGQVPKLAGVPAPAKLTEVYGPDGALFQFVFTMNPDPPEWRTPPPLPSPSEPARRKVTLPLVLAWVGVGILVLLLVRPLGGRVLPAALLMISLLLAASYAALVPVVKNPFTRLFGALFIVVSVIALILGVLYGGCVLIMKGIR